MPDTVVKSMDEIMGEIEGEEGGIYHGADFAPLSPTHYLEGQPVVITMIVRHGREIPMCRTMDRKLVSIKGKHIVKIPEGDCGKLSNEELAGLPVFPVQIPFEGMRVLMAAMHTPFGYAEGWGWVANKQSETTCLLSFPMRLEGRKFVVRLPETYTFDCELP